MRLLEIIFEVVAPSVMPYLRRAAGALRTIIGDPIRFIGNLVRAAVQGLPPDEFGAGAAVNQAIRQLGATFGVALTVAVLGTVTPTIAADAFGGVWAMLVICGVLTSVAAVSLPRRQPAVRAVAVPVVAGAQQ